MIAPRVRGGLFGGDSLLCPPQGGSGIGFFGGGQPALSPSIRGGTACSVPLRSGGTACCVPLRGGSGIG
jgi:hypothetical protein